LPMSDTKKIIEKYLEVEQIGKEQGHNGPESKDTKDTAVKIQKDTDFHPSRPTEGPRGETLQAGEPCKEEPLDILKKELEAAKQELKNNQDRYLRTYAEFENYKKRTAREMADFRKFANESLIQALLPVVDNLERAIESSNSHTEADSPIVQGVEMTLKEMRGIFERFNVTPIEAAGQPFDPRFHQAFQQEESNGVPENTVTQELQKGYMLHDRLLRPSMVVVSKKSPTSGADA